MATLLWPAAALTFVFFFVDHGSTSCSGLFKFSINETSPFPGRNVVCPKQVYTRVVVESNDEMRGGRDNLIRELPIVEHPSSLIFVQPSLACVRSYLNPSGYFRGWGCATAVSPSCYPTTACNAAAAAAVRLTAGIETQWMVTVISLSPA